MTPEEERAHCEVVSAQACQDMFLVSWEDRHYLADLIARERAAARAEGPVPAAAKVLADMVIAYVNDVVDDPDGSLWVARLAALKVAAGVVLVALTAPRTPPNAALRDE